MRIGKLNSSFLGVGRWGWWSRRVVSTLALLASLTALALILDSQYGPEGSGKAEALAYSTEGLALQPEAAGASDSVAALTPAQEDRYRALSDFVARRYRVSQDAAFNLVTHAHRAGQRLQLDPLLIIAVIAIESRFNPIAESVAGAQGLMQIIPKYHGDKLDEYGGAHAVFDPEINIQVGSRILKEYIRHTGNLTVGLQMYAGALGDGEDQYTRKVLNERARLQQVLLQTQKRPPAVKTASIRRSHSPVLPLELD